MHFIEIQFNDVILEQLFNVEYSIDVLPVVHADALAYLKQLILKYPVSARAFVVPVAAGGAHVLVRVMAVSCSFRPPPALLLLPCAAIHCIDISLLAHFHEFKKQCLSDLRHGLSHEDFAFEASRMAILNQIWKSIEVLKRADENKVDLVNVHDVDWFEVHPQRKFVGEENFFANFSH